MAKSTVSIPQEKTKVDKLIAKAEKNLSQMREVEAAAGFASPEDLSALELAKTAEVALHAALSLGNWVIAAEAYVMLSQALKRVVSIQVPHEKLSS